MATPESAAVFLYINPELIYIAEFNPPCDTYFHFQILFEAI